ncbi:MAG: winged helix-turn-helix transcriptional regulator [Candidatus Methanomethylophilaceae archaeon]|nr:winged helix-turn-helix transcriptional regulator [Candidatus Methanomethylophilaceae archaeon]
MGDGAMTEFELYYTGDGLVQVTNDVKRCILSQLTDRDLTLSELAQATGKAQSTISVHLEKLQSDRLISSRDDPKDNRKKIYSLTAISLSYSKPSSEDAFESATALLQKVVDDPDRTRDHFVPIILMCLDGLGLCVEPMSRAVGELHGMALEGRLNGEDIRSTISNAKRYYNKLMMGELDVFSVEPLVFTIHSELYTNDDILKVVSGYTIGFLSKVLEDFTGDTFEVASTEIYGAGPRYLRFTLERRSRVTP